MKKNKKKTLLLALFVSLGAISSFSLIVGLSSLAKYNAKKSYWRSTKTST